jgi:fermentation-respiration switch protein FrsA (DUF1100 family)
MKLLKSVLLVALLGYLGFVGLLYLMQRALLYPGDPNRTTPAAAGVGHAVEEFLTTADGEKVIAWHVPPKDERPVILYFHGNGGALRHRAERFLALTADGIGLVALSYRGYGGSSGRPTEQGLLHDARAAYEFARIRYPASRLVAWGESLGTGVAVAIAGEKEFSKVVLEAPYTSTVEIAAALYPIVPVRYLMHDQFRSDERIALVTEPILVLHGDRDTVIPIEYGRRLFERIAGPKRFALLAGGAHEGLDAFGALAEVKKFIAE